MFSTSTLLGPRISGFVPFESGGTIHGDLAEIDPVVIAPARPSVASPRVEPASDPSTAWSPRTSAVWAPASSVRVRCAEAAVLLAVVAYFAVGFLMTLGGL